MLEELQATLQTVHPLLVPAAGLMALLIGAWLISIISKFVILRVFRRAAGLTKAHWDDLLLKRKVIKRMVQILPAVVVFLGAPWVPDLPETMTEIVRNVAMAYIALMAVLAANGLLTVCNDLYEMRQKTGARPIKGYIQVAKILLFCVGLVLIISTLLDRSPLILLSGLGALTAVVLLVFKDTLLSLVASIQLASLDMVRVGDWIEMPQFNADGDVIDIELHTIRVQNWDKTITTIPTHRLISDSFKNWRGMSRSGGRRIKRSIIIDMQTVRFLTPDEISRFETFALLREYMADKQAELSEYNDNLDVPTDAAINLRRLTNLGTFRAYVYNYLKHHPHIHHQMTLLVRQLTPQAQGIPIELYCFTNTTNWSEYEAIQSDLFDHMLASLSEFGLRVYQQPAGADINALQHMLRD
ncbi:MAG: mechanosensitive ion channel family protein [Pseudomonadales bacterium]